MNRKRFGRRKDVEKKDIEEQDEDDMKEEEKVLGILLLIKIILQI